MRLQRFIAQSGLTSRRKAEDLIVEGKVRVNGRMITELGSTVDPKEDVIEVDNVPLRLPDEFQYIVLNKPKGVITALSDPEGRPTVIDLLQGMVKERVFPVGRLDFHSEGLLLLTNDGDLANDIIHPSSKIKKVYEVKIFGHLSEGMLNKLKSGVSYHGTFLKPYSVRILQQLQNKTWLEFTLEEGKNREIRKICAGAGITIDRLRRISIGGLTVEDLAPGKFYFVDRKKLTNFVFYKERTGDGAKKALSTKKYFKSVKRRKDVVLANSDHYYKFRKEHYQSTMKSRKEGEDGGRPLVVENRSPRVKAALEEERFVDLG